MGQEAIVAATVDGKRTHGKALLEEAEVILRGDVRARVPFGEIQELVVEDGWLEVSWSGGTLALELGPDVAEKWAAKIRNPPSRAKKLGLGPGARVAVVGDAPAWFVADIRNAGAEVTTKSPVDLLFFVAAKRAELSALPSLAKRLAPAGALWVIRPKGKDTPVTETDTRRAGLDAGLVDVKVAAFSATHTAEKFVVPVAKRRG
ncbi:MAG: hypothetical protein JWM82_4465 [Myxococcales bacterium]|nr:hypothetical protein [Myxococcales bacterium]